MGYNPADYVAVENEAKAMSKDELERDYVKRKDKNYASIGTKIGSVLLVAFFVFCIWFIPFLTIFS